MIRITKEYDSRLDELVDEYGAEYEYFYETDNTRLLKIFLSGAMTGLSKEEQTIWRYELKKIGCGYCYFFDPTIYDAENMDKEYQKKAEEYCIGSIVLCDCVIVNLKNIEWSVGTCQEIMLAWLLKKPIIGFYPKQEDIKSLHPWIEGKLTTKFASIGALKIWLKFQGVKNE